MDSLEDEYWEYVKTGIYKSHPEDINTFINYLVEDISRKQGTISYINDLLKWEKLHPFSNRAKVMRSDIEYYKDDIKLFRKRKTELKKLLEKPKRNKTPSIKKYSKIKKT